MSVQGPLVLGFWVWGLGVWGLGLTIMTLMMGASRSQESATRVKGRMQSVVNMISVNSEQNTRLTWGHEN